VLPPTAAGSGSGSQPKTSATAQRTEHGQGAVCWFQHREPAVE